MSDERRVAATVPHAYRHEHDRAHDWAALECFADLATRSSLVVSADDLMWMGAAEFADGGTIYSYKHVDTRRCLHVDAAGHSYRYLTRVDGGGYLPEEVASRDRANRSRDDRLGAAPR